MTRSPFLRALFLLSCVLLVSTRVAGAHLHYCRDGAEAPVAMHYVEFDSEAFHVHQEAHGDGAVHLHHAGPVHSDVVVAVDDEAPPQKLLVFADLDSLPPQGAVLAALPTISAWLSRDREVREPRANRWFSQPPARGPPA